MKVNFEVIDFHVHPDYVKESCEEIDFAVKNGVRLIS